MPRIEILSDEPLEQNCELCNAEKAKRLVRYKLDGVSMRRFMCLACRKWMRQGVVLPKNIRAERR